MKASKLSGEALMRRIRRDLRTLKVMVAINLGLVIAVLVLI